MGTLIRNGFIHDGSGNPPFKGDILVHGEKIVKIGTIEKRRVRKIIDASNAVVTPGFIDIGGHLNFDLDIFSDNSQRNYLKQGITTLIGGNNGFSLAPINKNFIERINELRTGQKTNINWVSLKELFDVLNRLKLKINFGTLVGYQTLKSAVLAKESRDLTDNELKLLKKVLGQALDGGAYGLSFACFCSKEEHLLNHELIELLEIVCAKKRIFSVSEEKPENIIYFFEEIAALANSLDLNIEVNNFKPIKKFEIFFKSARDIFLKRAATTLLNFDCSPSDENIVSSRSFLPPEFQELKKGEIIKFFNLKDFIKKVSEHLKRFNAEEIILADAPKTFSKFKGLDLKEIAQKLNSTPTETLLKLIKFSEMQAIFFKKNINVNFLDECVFASYSIISSPAASSPR